MRETEGRRRRREESEESAGEKKGQKISAEGRNRCGLSTLQYTLRITR